MIEADGGADRRTAARVDTHQHVIFSDQRAMGPLRTGTAVDRSTGGMRIVTAFPEPVGASVQIELQHSGGSGVTLLEGRVMHVVAIEGGQYAMGIRLVSKMLRPPAPPRVAGGPGAPPLAPAGPRRLDVAVGSARDAMPAATAQNGAREAVTFRRVQKRGGAGSWIGVVAILALVVILVLLVLEAMKDERRSATLDGVYRDTLDAGSVVQTAGLATMPGSPAWGSVDDDAHSMTKLGTPVRDAQDAFEAVPMFRDAAGRGLDDAASGALSDREHVSLPERDDGRAVERFASRLEFATEAYEQGDQGVARAVVRQALREGDSVPGVWREYGESLTRFFVAPDGVGNGAALRELLSFGPARASSSPVEAGFHVEVDASEHALRVWRDGEMVAEFPVGLGRDGATPTGTFRIANKVSDPAWYPADGRVVAARDPGNPIGSRWMGLAGGEGAAGIGIHPTRQAASIGGNASEGCVRMRPGDAEALYRLVPVGTAVVIHE